MKSKYCQFLLVALVIFRAAVPSIGQQSVNTIDYQVTYETGTQIYNVWVVPNYGTPNAINPDSFERGATAQVTLKVPTGFTIANITDVVGSWGKSPLKMGPAEQPSLLGTTTPALPSGKSYYVIGKELGETNYGQFQNGQAIKLFTFTGSGCFGPVEVISSSDVFIIVSDNVLSLNIAPSFYSISGQNLGGNIDPAEQFRAPFGAPANCFDAVNDEFTALANIPTSQDVLVNDSFGGVTPAMIADLNVSVTTQPTNGTATVNAADGTITYTSNSGFTGTDTYIYQICDKANPTVCETATVTVVVSCQVVIAPTGSVSSQPSCAVATGSITVSLPVNGTGISYTVTGTSPVVASVSNATGIFSGLAAGTYSVTVTNGSGCSSSAVSLTVDAQPVTPAAPTGSVSSQPSCVVATGTITVSLPANGTGISYTVTGTSPVVASVSNATGLFSGLAAGTYSVTVTNGSGCTSSAVSLTVDAQPITPIAPTILSPVTYCQAATATALTATPPNGSTLLWYTTATGGTGSTTVSTPVTTTAGTTSFYVSSVSTAGCESSTRAQIDVNVTVCRVIYAFNDNNLTPINTLVSGDVLINDDINNGTGILVVTVTPVQQPGNGIVTLQSDGTYTYTPSLNFTGVDSFIYRTCDQGSPAVCATATVYIKIINENDPVNNNPPIAHGDNYSTTPVIAVTGNVLLNDKDPDAGQTLTAAKLSDPANGTVVLNSDGTFTYTPNSGFTGTDTFIYTACDTGSPTECDDATVQIEVKEDPTPGNNLPPVAISDLVITPLGINAIGNVSQNDTDPNATTLTVNTTPILLPANGTITLSPDGSYTYIPNGSFTGIDKVVYEVCDAGTPVQCTQATLIIYVLEGKVSLLPKAYLQGSLFGVAASDMLMRDDLRVKNLIPLSSPYDAIGLTALTATVDTDATVLAVTGANAIVDWVFVELRSATNSQQVEDSRSALIQRDGDIVDVDGVSPITFSQVSSGSYYVVIKHRNHLGVMTQLPIALSPTTTTVDFRLTITPIYTISSSVVNKARINVEQGAALWAGNALFDDTVAYQGSSNDVNLIYDLVIKDANNIFDNPSFKIKSYNQGDLNMDGETILQGSGNDLEYMYQNVINNHPGNALNLIFFSIQEQLPL